MTKGLYVEELLRTAVRQLLPRNTFMGVAQIYTDVITLWRLGWSRFAQLQRARSQGNVDFAIALPNLQYPIWIRPKTADPSEVVHTVIRESYRCAIPEGPVSAIIDAGANIGDSTCWYLSRFPDATVVAMEPDRRNFAALGRNVSPYGDRAKLVRAGLWEYDAHLTVCDGGSSIGMFVKEVEEGSAECSAFSPETLMRMFSLTRVDIFKIDIEGAEELIFKPGRDSWMDRARLIVVDVHSARADQIVREAGSRRGFSCARYRELLVLSHPTEVRA